MTRRCKHSKGVEGYIGPGGEIFLWCYSCHRNVACEMYERKVNMYTHDYDSTIARIAGNILAGYDLNQASERDDLHVHTAVRIARKIVAEVRRTEAREPQQREGESL